MDYLLAKALHMVGFVSWFAGLFYLVRLFIYHAEAGERSAAERDILQPQLELMAARLWSIITVPAMILTLIAGAVMVVQLENLAGWLNLKFGLVAGLVAYTVGCDRIRRRQAAKRSGWSASRLRVFNEVATLFMVAIVFLAVYKSSLGLAWGLGGLVGLGLVLMAGIRGYRWRSAQTGGERS